MRLYLAVAMVFSFASYANADLLPVANPSFEDPALANGVFVEGVVDWECTSGFGVTCGTFNPATSDFPSEAPDGSNVSYLYQTGVMRQSMGLIQPGHYSLTAQVGLDQTLALANHYVALVTDVPPVVLAVESSASPAPGTFTPVSLSYYAAPNDPSIGSELFIEVAILGLQASKIVYLESVQLDFVPVPEPASCAGFGIGLLILAHVRRRHRSD